MSKVEPKYVNSKRTFKRRDYLNGVDLRVMDIVGMSLREWLICDHIEYWCNHEASGAVAITRAELGEIFALSADRMKYIVRDLVNRGFLKVVKNYHLMPTEKWIEMTSVNGLPIPENFLKKKTKPKETKPKPKEESENPQQDESPKESKEAPKNISYPYFEEEFGQDEHSGVGRPSLNQVRKKAVSLHKQKEITEKLAVEIGTSYWRKQEKCKWHRVSNMSASLKRYIDGWKRNAEKYPDMYPEREKRIVVPRNNEEMRLWFQQLSDKERMQMTFTVPGLGLVIIDSRTGVPVVKDSGEFLSIKEFDKFMNFCVKNFKDIQLRLK
jgi:hypothetical protein